NNIAKHIYRTRALISHFLIQNESGRVAVRQTRAFMVKKAQVNRRFPLFGAHGIYFLIHDARVRLSYHIARHVEFAKQLLISRYIGVIDADEGAPRGHASEITVPELHRKKPHHVLLQIGRIGSSPPKALQLEGIADAGGSLRSLHDGRAGNRKTARYASGLKSERWPGGIEWTVEKILLERVRGIRSHPADIKI